MPRFFPSLLLALSIAATAADGTKLTFPERELELTVPAGWETMDPPTGGVAMVRNPEQTKVAVLIVADFPKGVPVNTADFAVGARKSVQASGGVVVGEGKVTVGSVEFETLKIAREALGRPNSYLCTTFVNNSAVSLALNSGTVDPSTDPELASILQGVRFLTPPKPVAARPESARLLLPLLLTLVVVGGLIVGLVIFLIRRRRAMPVPPLPPTQKF